METGSNQQHNTKTTEQQEDKGLGYYFNFSEVLGYYFRKKDPNNKPSINTRMMHGINKISIVMFLLAVIVMVTRAILRA